MGTQGRYFGRWLMPVLPILCLLAAFFAREVLAVRRAGGVGRRCAGPAPAGRPGTGGRARPPGDGSRAAGGLHGARLARARARAARPGAPLQRALGARALARGHPHADAPWMVAHVPRGTKVVVEPVSPDEWAREPPGSAPACPGTRYRWCKWPSLYTFITPAGAIDVARQPPGRHRELRAHARACADRATTSAAASAGS